MFCKKCGAAVVGKFCSCCGARIRSQAQEFRLEEKRRERNFRDTCYNMRNSGAGLDLLHLATACWMASNARYNKFSKTLCLGDDVPAECYESLNDVERHAMGLFIKLLSF